MVQGPPHVLQKAVKKINPKSSRGSLERLQMFKIKIRGKFNTNVPPLHFGMDLLQIWRRKWTSNSKSKYQFTSCVIFWEEGFSFFKTNAIADLRWSVSLLEAFQKFNKY